MEITELQLKLDKVWSVTGGRWVMDGPLPKIIKRPNAFYTLLTMHCSGLTTRGSIENHDCQRDSKLLHVRLKKLKKHTQPTTVMKRQLSQDSPTHTHTGLSVCVCVVERDGVWV